MADIFLPHLHPELQILYPQWLKLCIEQDLHVRIIQGYRDPAYQDQLHLSGISPLTSAQSKHCFQIAGQPASKAFDFGVFTKDNSYVTNGNDSRYVTAGKIAESLKLTWGQRFHHPDPDHIEMP